VLFETVEVNARLPVGGVPEGSPPFLVLGIEEFALGLVIGRRRLSEPPAVREDLLAGRLPLLGCRRHLDLDSAAFANQTPRLGILRDDIARVMGRRELPVDVDA
jgi:hypothetical protein